jgi:predicted nucleic acid-binding Zn finger protein
MAVPVLPKDQEFLDEHFSISPAWKQFHKNLKKPQFVSTVRQDSRADNKLKRFARMVGTRQQSKAKPVAVVGDSGKKYKVKYHPEAGRFSCSCPDWTYKRSVRNKGAGGECKHISRLRQGQRSSMMDKVANPILDIVRLGAGVKREEISRDKSKKRSIQYKAYKKHFPQENILAVLARSGGFNKRASVRGSAAQALLAKK